MKTLQTYICVLVIGLTYVEFLFAINCNYFYRYQLNSNRIDFMVYNLTFIEILRTRFVSNAVCEVLSNVG